ncbi:MAG: BspA family leucine-rich repeat surface protein, partial [Prevotella sp.]|nr:BspA family leucine-rich repeat surface protein [Prevotella sp.]
CMFYVCKNLTNLDVREFKTSNVTVMNGMFSECIGLTSLDVSGFNTSSVTDMSSMFYGCKKLTNLDVSGFNTSNVTDMSYMFSGCSGLTSLNVSGFNTSNVANMSGMFNGCSGLMSLDVSDFNTSNVWSMRKMFGECSKLKNIDVRNFDTSNVRDIGWMFKGCETLTSLDVSGFNTSDVIYMDRMFSNCKNLMSLDVSGFNTSNVSDIDSLFCNCETLTSLDVSGFNTSNVTNMSYMFSGCLGLTSLDVSGFNTSNVKHMTCMFLDCSGLTSLDVSGFNTSYVIYIGGMFNGCSSLNTIYCNDRWPSSTTFTMFKGCTALKGAISYDDKKTAAYYANPEDGYFTYKTYGDLTILNTQITGKNYKNLSLIDGVEGTASYDPTTNTLYLKDCMITSTSNQTCIKTVNNADKPTLNIRIEGTCTVYTKNSPALWSQSRYIIIGGNGVLNLQGGQGIYVNLPNVFNNVIIKDTVTVNIDATVYGIRGGNTYSDGWTYLYVRNNAILNVKGTTRDIHNLNYLGLGTGIEITSPKDAKFDGDQGTVVVNGTAVADITLTIKAPRYDLSICGTQVSTVNCSDLTAIPGVTGTVSYDNETKTLYLENASIAENTMAGGLAVENGIDSLTINVIGNCSISSIAGTGIRSTSKNLTITGTGTLDITARTNGIMMTKNSVNDLVVNGSVTVDIYVDNYGVEGAVYASRSAAGVVTSNPCTTLRVGGLNAKLSVNGLAKCFQTLGGFIADDGYEVTSPSGTAYYNRAYYSFCTATINTISAEPTVTLVPVADAAVVIEKTVTFQPGDVNGDGSITMADANMVVNYFLSTDPSSITNFNVNAADVNGDKAITMADANQIVNIFLGQ